MIVLENNERRKEIINIKNVYKTYPNGVGALFDLNLSIYLGEFVFIIGGSGSGKSTLIKMLYREEKPTRGEIILGGVNVGKLRNSKVYKLRRLIGVVFQDYKLLPKLTVYENVAFALDVTGVDSKTIRKRVLDVLDKVGLKHKAKEYPDKLSGGEQQRVAIARAVVNRYDYRYAYGSGPCDSLPRVLPDLHRKSRSGSIGNRIRGIRRGHV